MFRKIILNYENNLFDQLVKSNEFETVCTGRGGAILVNNINDIVPLVRSTTKYELPAQKFKQVHYDIISSINKIVTDTEFNNAMVEIYDNSYRSMKYHSDQELDLKDDSLIAIFSCYESSNAKKFEKISYQK